MNFVISFIIVTIVVLLDQYSKREVFSYLTQFPFHAKEITSFFNLVTVYNYGISFGMLNDLEYGRWILALVAVTVTVALLIWLIKSNDRYLSVALSLIIGGAIGNIVDRVRYGAVADFLDFHINNYHWPAFNIADSAVFVGTALICIEQIFFHKRGDNNEAK